MSAYDNIEIVNTIQTVINIFPPIIELNNEPHDCVIDIADSQHTEEDQIMSFLEEGLLDKLIKKPYINIEVSTRSLGKGQDAVYRGKFKDAVGSTGDYVVVYDGHGTNTCIHAIRSFNQDEIMSDTEPVNCVIDKIRKYRKID